MAIDERRKTLLPYPSERAASFGYESKLRVGLVRPDTEKICEVLRENPARSARRLDQGQAPRALSGPDALLSLKRAARCVGQTVHGVERTR